MSGQKIINGLKDAIAGNVRRVTIDGQTWERVNRKPHDPPAEDEVNHLGRQIDELLRENERLRAGLNALFPAEEKQSDGSSVDHSADGNLEAVISDLEARKIDKVCISTLSAIMLQLTAARVAYGQT